MYNYANRFTVLTNQNKTEFLLKFAQDAPVISSMPDTDGSSVNVESMPVADIVVTGELAREIARLISKTLEQE